MTNTTRQGFTIIELLVAMVILMLLVTVAGVSFSSSLDASRNAKRRADLEMVRAALEMYRSQQTTKSYPIVTATDDGARFTTLVTLLSGTPKYLSTSSLKDPLDGQGSFKYYFDSTASAYQVCALLEATSLPSGCVAGTSVTLTAPTGTILCCLNQP